MAFCFITQQMCVSSCREPAYTIGCFLSIYLSMQVLLHQQIVNTLREAFLDFVAHFSAIVPKTHYYFVFVSIKHQFATNI
ncbi:TPA: hypothetical protein SLN74_000420 [Proteus mirabilis]|uniref:hypothetical protein n=1 Tax=Proteus mirabilis TaxID=584 RepID=UPI001625F92B|nr:hypothetical protein [Proteus mirabilis]HAU5545330.1 hypothetical protein [Proteus mirabilis]HAU5578290.1 hypothetical protein [Proteus mirabilis]HCT3368587.1 hypothetical protein [Proteus mirabilis]HCU0913273.1 hypothetical protein [Proteus mirabilis]HEI9874053.1 hypothetical protein [Proteus mirabilis]